ncbi:MAG: hypothetical protein K2N41_09770 [Lachnospiraceae bacterium]|nr:hypothetical protein [Lachnospiraceae bacterium]MDE5819534.1 hypothetical protein [Lachnospiraceae bacterium]MDE7239981.1 hypothetical protein [Lachnospiraceae bacterium]
MDESQMIDNLIAQLDAGMTNGVGHVNVDVDETSSEAKSVETMGCVDCSKNAFACSIPTMQEGMDR